MLKIRNRAIRIVVKTLLYAGVFILFLFAVLSVYIEINKKKILADFGSQLSKKMNGKISYNEADITIWKSFPFIGLQVSNARLADSMNIPLLKMEKISFRVSLLQYFRANTELNDVSLQNGFIHLFTDSSGYTNKYLYDKEPRADQQKNRLDINNAVLKNVRVVIENKQKNKRFDVLFKRLDAGIANSKNIIKIKLDQASQVNGLGFNLSKGSFLKGQLLKGFTRLRYDKEQALLSFEDGDFNIDGHPYSLKGNFWFRRNSFDLSVITKQAPFEKLKHVFAENIYTDLKNIRLGKPVDVTAKLEGSLAYHTIPKVTAQWTVKDNSIKVPVADLTHCSFEGIFSNEIKKGLPFTDENSGITVSRFSGNWEGILLKSDKISITNLVHPVADMRLQSSTDLRSLNDKLGLNTIEFISGTASLDLHYNGPLEKDVDFIDKLNGRLRFSNGTIQYRPRDFTFRNCSGDVSFSPDMVQANDLRFDLGANHFNVDVAGTNPGALSAASPGAAVINCNVQIPSLDLAGLRSLFASKKAVEAPVKGRAKIFSATNKIDDVLDHGQLKIFLNARSVAYNNFKGKDLKGTVTFSGNDLFIYGVSVGHASGIMKIDANISQAGSMHHTSAKVKLDNVDVAAVFRAFDDFGQDGISYQNLRGRLNASTDISMVMDNAGNILPGSMNGTVVFSLKNGALVNYEPMQNIKGFVFKNKDMTNVAFAELKNTLEVNNYKIRIPRMEIQSTAIGMFVEGVYDLKKTGSKIEIQVPLKGLKQRDSSYVPQNIGINTKAGTSIYLEGKNDKTGKVKIGLNTTKTIRKLF
jgi:hypothetical protein